MHERRRSDGLPLMRCWLLCCGRTGPPVNAKQGSMQVVGGGVWKKEPRKPAADAVLAAVLWPDRPTASARTHQPLQRKAACRWWGCSFNADLMCLPLASVAQAHQRRGTPCSAVQWGAWSGVGMVAGSAAVLGRMRRAGVAAVTPAAGVGALAALLAAPRPPAVLAAVPFLWGAFLRRLGAAAAALLL